MLEEKLKALEHQYAELEARLAAPETYGDPARVARLNKEQRELEPVVTTYRAWVRRRQDLQEAEGLLSDPDMKELAQEEYASAKADLESMEERLKILAEALRQYELLPITCSIGITHVSSRGFSYDESLRQADTALYRSKKENKGGYSYAEEQEKTDGV